METSVEMGQMTFHLGIGIIALIGLWKCFVKAREPGWAAIVPIYNYLVYLKIADKPWWWLLLGLIPIVNIVFYILATAAFASKFGKGGGFTVGLILLPVVFYLILGFGKAEKVA